METWISSEEVFSGRVFSVRSGLVLLDDGSRARRDVVEHGGGVGIVPIMADGEVVLVRQYRIAIGREIIEIPAGRLEKGELPEDCASREIEEELGFRAGKLALVHSYYSAVGFTNEKMYIYLAMELEPSEARPEWDERIQVVRLPLAEIEAQLLRGEFEDAKTIIGLFAALAHWHDLTYG